MASSSKHTNYQSEEPRPPEDPLLVKRKHELDHNYRYYTRQPSGTMDSRSLPAGDFNAATTHRPNNSNNIMKTQSYRSRRPVSETETTQRTNRKRRSYHQDVEEALSSLLWQPYEYRTQSDSSDTLSSVSTGSSISTSLSARSIQIQHSFTDDFLNLNCNATTTLGNGNAGADRDPAPEQMVTNLPTTGVGSRMHQCASDIQSRGHHFSSMLSKVDLEHDSRVSGLVLNGCDGVVNNSAVVSGDMQQADNNVLLHYNGTNSASTRCAISSDLIPSNMTSVVSANVVGLPVHTRTGSNLSATNRTGADTVPATVTTNSHHLHFRNGSNLATDTPVQMSRAGSEPAATTTASISISANRDPNQRCTSVPQSNISLDVNVAQLRLPPTNVNVNYYRAVPVNVVSNVPTIQCVNSVVEPPAIIPTGNDGFNNVSNVHIIQAMPTEQQVLVQPQPEVRTRTFTSTEAQTDDTTVGASNNNNNNREQRRRDRRERRHQRRLNYSNHQHQPTQLTHIQSTPQQQQQQQQNDRLPDLLNNHFPPPYSTLPAGLSPPIGNIIPGNTIVPNPLVQFHPGVVPGPPAPVTATATGFRFPFPTAAGFRRCRSRLGPRYSTEETHQPKSCCGFLISRPGSLRWFIALIALVAVCCVLVGTVLGAMRPAGRDHLTVSLLMIGVGIVLVTVSGVAWRLTSQDAPSCRAMFGLEANESTDVLTRRFVPRLPPSYGRPHHPYAAMIYPEFQYRPPPPSYQASMQEYRLRLLLLDRGTTAAQIQTGGQHIVSPPPTYRSHAGSLLRAPLSNRRDASQSEYSCPPSYRSRTSSNRQPSQTTTALHSREQSLSLSESNHDGSVVNVVNILGAPENEITLDSLKVVPGHEIPPLRMLLKSGSGSDLETVKDGNLVTIVQKADQSPVIVTVSGSQMATTNTVEVGSSQQIPSEMEILAHL